MRVNNQPSVTGKNQTFGMAFKPVRYMTMANKAEQKAMELAEKDSAIAKMAEEFDVQTSRVIKVEIPLLAYTEIFPDTLLGEIKADKYKKRYREYESYKLRNTTTHHYMIEVSKIPQTLEEKLRAFFGAIPKGCAISSALPERPKQVVSSEILVYKLEDIARDALDNLVNGRGLKSKERASLRALAEKHLADPSWQYMSSLKSRMRRFRESG